MIQHYKYYLLWLIILMVYLLGWRIDLMDVDAAQYASISKEMTINKSYLQIFDLGRDYLDKPPLLFWITSFFMTIFGTSDVVYRFVNLIFALIAIFSTYQFAKKYYAPPIPYYASLILGTCQALFLITHDCRTDTMLMGWVMLSVWLFSEALSNKKITYYIFAFAAMAGGLMTKGPIAIAIVIFAFGGYFLYRKKWNYLFKWQYLVGILTIGILIIPMCIGLYLQFDLHPEKILYKQSEISGLKFFFWTQSFGRITGESTWSEHGNFFFLLQNMVWSYAPWILFFLAGWLIKLKQIVKKSAIEEITFFGFTLTYIALAMSRYQLPHYIFVVFPFASIITAEAIHEIRKKTRIERISKFTKFYTFFYIFNFIIVSALWLLIPIIHFYVFPLNWSLIFALLLIVFLIVVLLKRVSLPTFIKHSLVTLLTINVFLSTWFYPNLLQYQLGSNVGKYLKSNNRNATDFFTYKIDVSHSFVFYSNILPKNIEKSEEVDLGNWILTDQNGFKELEQKGLILKILKSGLHTAVTTLNIEWLNKNTRFQNSSQYFLVEVTGKLINS
ncbi:MAG: glycosyltransferase family 39 protein [Saprospiraceae bacterium]|nr:glycosyltransferase family 39 protein [Saprospiraceae bacterium]